MEMRSIRTTMGETFVNEENILGCENLTGIIE